MISDVSIRVNRDLCYACGACVDRCIMDNLRLSVAPCRQACPLNINCQGYVRLIAQGREEEAAQELGAYAPFAGILGRICTGPCEDRCEREASGGDGPVHIRALKRYLSERFSDVVGRVPKVSPDTGRRVAIVGSGPAGMMAAYDLRVRGHNVDVFESGDTPGGFLTRVIPEYRLPAGEVDRAVHLLSAIGVRFQTGNAVGRDIPFQVLLDDYDSVIVAVGACAGHSPDVSGSDCRQVLQGIDLLEAARCGTPPQLQGSGVVIVGGGNTAVDCAITCRMLGADPVRLVCLENPLQMPARRSELDQALSLDVIVDYAWAVTRISGEPDGGVSLSLARCLTAFDEKGVFNPLIDMEGPGRILSADVVVLAVGQKVDTGLYPSWLIAEDERRLAGDSVTQRVPGREEVFVAGDCFNGQTSVVEAFASGRRAAFAAHRYLSGQDAAYGTDYYQINGLVRAYESLPERSVGGSRCSLPAVGPDSWALDREIEQVLSPEAARIESERCLSCGRSFELNRTCWYCLPCEIDCPVQALEVRMPYQVR